MSFGWLRSVMGSPGRIVGQFMWRGKSRHFCLDGCTDNPGPCKEYDMDDRSFS